MALYDMYEKYRDENLTPQEQAQIKEAEEPAKRMEADSTLERRPGGFYNEREGFTPHPVVGAHMMIAQDRAQAQFKGKPPMPEDENVGIRFPGVDPVGKYSVIDMKFAQRELAIRAALESRAPEVQEYVKGLLDKRTSKKLADSTFSQRHFMMTESAKKHRDLTRGSKLCLDADGRKLMHQQAVGMETDLPVVQYDQLMQGIEYAAGVRTGPVPKEITDFYKDTLKTELDLGMVAAAGRLDKVPAKINVEFQDLDHKLLHSAFSNPENWGKSAKDLDVIVDKMDHVEISTQIPPYALATADRVIDPLFRGMEKEPPANFRDPAAIQKGTGVDIMFSRGDLISIDGKTVRETMQEQFTASGKAGSFDDFYKQNVKQMTNELVAAGLMAGKRVEAFVPDRNGQIPKEPTQITKTGYEPSPLKPERFNAWQRHFAKRGFYKNKVARQQQYERVMAARDRMRSKAAISEAAHRQERTELMQDAIARREALSPKKYENMTMFFGKVMDEMAPQLQTIADQHEHQKDVQIRTFTTDANGVTRRTYNSQATEAMNTLLHTMGADGAFILFSRTEPVDTCICALMAKGYKYQDIMDPNKLQEERDAIGREFVEHAKVNDQEWLGRTFYAGHKAAVEQARELTRGLDPNNPSHFRRLAEAEAMVHSAFGMSQQLAERDCHRGYQLGCRDDLGTDDLALASQTAEALNGTVNDLAHGMEVLFKGVAAQATLARDGLKAGNLILSRSMMDLGAAKIVQTNLKPGNSLAERVPPYEETMAYRAASGASGSSVGKDNPISLYTLATEVLAPDQEASFMRDAASGRLFDRINARGDREPAFNLNGPAMRNEQKFELVQGEDGSIKLSETIVQERLMTGRVSFALDKPAPEPQDPSLPPKQVQAPQKQAPQKHGPQRGGMKR